MRTNGMSHLWFMILYFKCLIVGIGEHHAIARFERDFNRITH